MVFIDQIIHADHIGTEGVCPQCGGLWKKLPWWHLPFRYSLACCVMTVTDALSLAVLLYLGAEFVWGNDVLRAVLLTPLGWIGALISAASCITLAAFLVWVTIITKYWANNENLKVVHSPQCGYTCLIISDRGNKQT